jgi:hypothetical protein
LSHTFTDRPGHSGPIFSFCMDVDSKKIEPINPA